MPIYTPRGLNIRVEIPYAFALMARLTPQVEPVAVLKTTEGLEFKPLHLQLPRLRRLLLHEFYVDPTVWR